MSQPAAHTAILFFARRSAAEAREKTLSPLRNEAVLQHLRDHAWRTACATGLPCLIVDERRQQGSTFGERFTQAIQQVFRQGYRQVIAIGGDVPNLRKQHIQRAADLLRQHDWVLGPDFRGGAYLIACTREAFAKNLHLHTLPWQTSYTLKSLLQSAYRRQQSVALLSVLHDLNQKSDLSRWLAQNSHQRLRRLIQNLLQPATTPENNLVLLSSLLSTSCSGRAPPSIGKPS